VGQDSNARHGHGEDMNKHIGVEWFQDVARDERVIDSGVLVLAEVAQLRLPDIHDCRCWQRECCCSRSLGRECGRC
jgi:hypothetical protein